jgi:amino acid adenylation domain-containing protein
MQNSSLSGFRLSPQQGRVWAAQQAGPALVSQVALRLDGRLDADRVRDALHQVMGRHEVLRTTFRRRPGLKLPLQVIDEQVRAEWRTLDLAGTPAEQLAKLVEIGREERRRPFDIENGPLVRAVLATSAADRHALILTLPALCADGTSLQLLGRELATIATGGTGLNEEPLQYADFSEWQGQVLESDDEEGRAGKKYWSRPELTALAPVSLPLQGKKPAAAFEPEQVTATVPADVTARVEALASSQGGSPSAVFLAGWQALLARLTGAEEFIVGVVPEGRKQEELQEAMGLFAQALPVPCEPDNRTFNDLLAKTRDALAEARKSEEYFDAPEGVRTDIAFEFQPRWQTPAGAVTVSRLWQSSDLGRFTLKLTCRPADKGYEAVFSYDPSLLRAEDVSRFAGHFGRILAGLCADPAAPIGSPDIVGEEEKRQLVSGFNQTVAGYPRDKSIHQRFEDQAARTPDRPAVAFEGQRLSYAELNARANRLANYLRRQGVGRNVVVGLCVERSADMIVGLLGILKAGGAYVPLHPELPAARLTHLISETGAPLIVTEERLARQLPSTRAEVFCLDRDRAALDREPDTNPERMTTPEDLVYVIYTSGSTGLPKGVAVRHRNLVNYTHFIMGKLGLSAADAPGLHFATVSTLSADLGNTCIFPSLTSGGCLHVIGYETAMNAGKFARYVAANPIDVLKITPSHLGALLAASGEVLPRRFLFLGGEASTWELIDRVKAAGRCAAINHYGPTETTVGSLTFDVDQGMDARKWSDTVPVGRPIANTQVYLLDAQGRPVPLGVPGELCIGGDGVTQGYLNQPGQTAERFVADRFSGKADGRIYRTGDRARYLPDGAVEFLGRLDQQVKIRGFRVEPAEVEAVLRGSPAVREAVVIAQDDKGGDKRLIAYFVPASGKPAGADQLRKALLEQLPDYMVPAAFVPLDRLPLTPNGKIDRRALPNPEDGKLAGGKAYVAPRNPIEEKVAGIWQEVLQVERVGAHDDFFELGGHSLLATQVISRLRAAFQVELPLRSLFESPTVAGLAEAVTRFQAENPVSDEMNQMLAELEGMSDEEIQKLLAAELGNQ